MEELKDHLNNIADNLRRLMIDSEAMVHRAQRIEQQFDLKSSYQQRDLDALNSKIDKIIDKNEQQSNILINTSTKIESIVGKIEGHEQRISSLENAQKETSMTLWKLVGAGAGAGGIITVLLEMLQRLIK